MQRIKTIGVLYGGWSAEREVSLKSGKAVIEALEKSDYRVIPIDVDKKFLSKLIRSKIDFAFIALHGPFGEDGTVQAVLEMLNIPYSGSGVLASALAINKIYTKKILQWHKLPTPRWTVIDKLKVKSEKLEVKKIKFPVVVKPSTQGSTIGVSIVKNFAEFNNAVTKALSYNSEVIVEEYIPGKEITVGILGREALPVIEIIPTGSKFYDYKAKYAPGGSKHIIPARITKKAYDKLQKLALAAFDALNCRAVARIDFRLHGDKPYILEINTIPGLTETSLLPESAKYAGYSFLDMILKIIEYSLIP
ncbi:MAG: D-alanine--D-alanine ligase [Elusimicrobiota bacterium]|nr:D-alanine--D-alanine ligase [Elusimicrobiota bacterium]